jgi:hypothetical protein
MKKITFILAAVVITANMSAQNNTVKNQKPETNIPITPAFQKRQIDINLGLGLGNRIIGVGATKVVPPLSASVEYGITDDISLGGYVGYTAASYSYTNLDYCGNGFGFNYYTDTYKWSYFILAARGAYHFGRFIKVDRLDTYAGLMLGNNFAKSSYSTTSPCANHIAYTSPAYGGAVFAAYAGARYGLTDHFGVFGELGFGIAYLNIGLNFKF